MSPDQLRGNTAGAERLLAWGRRTYGSLVATARAIGVERNALRYAADPEYRERIKRRNTEEWRGIKADPVVHAEHKKAANVRGRPGKRPVVHLVRPGAGGNTWCLRRTTATEGRACKVCIARAMAWIDPPPGET